MSSSKYLLLFLSVLPGILIVIYIYLKDKKRPEPLGLLLTSIAFGVFSTYPAIKMEEFGIYDLKVFANHDPWMVFTFSYLIVAFSEELMKYIFLRYYVFPKLAFSEPIDGIVYAVAISMGFAMMENVLYVVVRTSDFDKALVIALSRMFTAVPAHASFAVFMGYFVGLAKFRPKFQVIYLVLGLMVPVLIHGSYDFFIFQRMSEWLSVFTILTLVLALVSSKYLIRQHEELPHSF